MDIYMYKYACPRWWGTAKGLRNMNADPDLNEKDVLKVATHDANKFTGSKTCDVSLLQKFHVNITPIKNYAALASIPFSVPKNNIIDNCDKKIFNVDSSTKDKKSRSNFTNNVTTYN